MQHYHTCLERSREWKEKEAGIGDAEGRRLVRLINRGIRGKSP